MLTLVKNVFVALNFWDNTGTMNWKVELSENQYNETEISKIHQFIFIPTKIDDEGYNKTNDTITWTDNLITFSVSIFVELIPIQQKSFYLEERVRIVRQYH